MIEIVDNPTFKLEDFDPSKKKLGISAIMRLKDEEDYLVKSINSILPFFDEIIIVYNKCTDQTPQIVEKFARQEPRRIRAFHYVPEVFPSGSEMHIKLSPNHVSSLVHYYNFALSKVTYRIFSKWDGDMIAAFKPFGQIIARLRKIKPWMLWKSFWSPYFRGFWWFSGVNLWDKDGKIYVNKTKPRAGNGDHGFWPVNPKHIFEHDPRWEILNTKGLRGTFVGFTFFHLKSMKKDRGLGVYQLEENPKSRYHQLIKEWWTNPELITFEEYCQIEPDALSLPNPESLGIQPVREN